MAAQAFLESDMKKESWYARRVSTGRHPMTVFLSKEEILLLKQRAQASGVTLTQLVQQVLVKEA